MTKYLKFLALIVVIFVTSCNKDFYDDPSNRTSQTKVRHQKFIDLEIQTKSKISNEIRRFSQLRNSAEARAEYDSVLDVYIDLEEVEVTIKDEKEFFTFSAYKLSDDKLKNAMFSEKTDGSWAFYILEYEITEEEYKLMSFEQRELLHPKVTEVLMDEGRVRLVHICDIVIETILEYNWSYIGGVREITVVHLSNCHWEFQGSPDSMNYSGSNPIGSSQSGGGSSTTQLSSSVYIMSAKQKRQRAFQESLSQDQRDCINESFTADETNEMYNFLEYPLFPDGSAGLTLGDNEPYLQSSENFAHHAIETICNGGEIDFADQITYDSTFVNTPKIKCVHEKLQTSGSSFYRNMLSKFDNLTDHNLTFKVGNVPGNQDYGITDGDSITANNYTITINSNLENLSNLAIMVALSHELIHAYMFDTLETLGVITFDSQGNPLTNVDCGNTGSYINVNYNSLTTEQKFTLLICSFAMYSPDQDWSHALFNQNIFSITSYQQQLQSFILNAHDWNNEEPAFLSDAQAIFGASWKIDLAKAISFIGLEDTAEYYQFLATYSSSPAKTTYIVDIRNKINLANSNCQ